MLHVRRTDAKAVLRDKNVRESLSRYFSVMQDEKQAKFLIARKLPVEFHKDDSLEQLWHIHCQATDDFHSLQQEIDSGEKRLEDLKHPEKSYLGLKIEIASRILEHCHFCTRRCGIDRLSGNTGYCKCGPQILVSSMFKHLGEEPELVPSGTIFTIGCTIRCLHCQNWTISQWFEPGEVYSDKRLALAIEKLRRNGCRNANLVGGEPTPWLQQWLQAFKHVNINVPIVWNSNSYYSEETSRLLASFVDVYLLDFKYGPGECARRISDAPSYWEVCTRNHLSGKRYGELLIRVLILPGHLECCTKPILKWIAENIGEKTRTNIMFQYRPEWRAYEIPELRRRLSSEEMQKATNLANEVKLTNYIT